MLVDLTNSSVVVHWQKYHQVEIEVNEQLKVIKDTIILKLRITALQTNQYIY